MRRHIKKCSSLTNFSSSINFSSTLASALGLKQKFPDNLIIFWFKKHEILYSSSKNCRQCIYVTGTQFLLVIVPAHAKNSISIDVFTLDKFLLHLAQCYRSYLKCCLVTLNTLVIYLNNWLVIIN